MRKIVVSLLATLVVAIAGCVTINVYFPEAAAEKAADQFIGSVIDGSAQATKPGAGESGGDKPAAEPAADDDMPPSASLLDLLIPAAYAAETPNLRIHTPSVDAIHDRMRNRFKSTLKPLLDNGAIGFTADGMIAMREASKVPLAQRAGANSAIADENRDRKSLYREIANANGHPEWESQVRETFAKLWIQKAHGGWYYQTSSGSWKRK